MPIYDEPGLAFGILGKTRPAGAFVGVSEPIAARPQFRNCCRRGAVCAVPRHATIPSSNRRTATMDFWGKGTPSRLWFRVAARKPACPSQ
jgi:hypothetical protein